MGADKPTFVLEAMVIAGLVGCGGSAPPPASPQNETASDSAAPSAPAPQASEPAPTEQAPQEKAELDVPPYGSSLERIMKAHFNDALLIREAVIAGKPEDAANPATVIANVQNLDDLPEGWRPFVEQMQQTAARVTNSTDLASAAAAAADLGVSCGSCHQQQHRGPKASTEPAPPAGTTVESRMKRHAWASERLWEALAVPAQDAWDAGSKALSTDPFPEEVLKKGGVAARSAAGDFAKLVAKAPTKKTTKDRAALYAELLVTCGTCHQATKQKE